jgi:hypothetical protein
MKTLIMFLVCAQFIILTSCEWFEPSGAKDRNPVVVFKYKDIDYSKNIWIGMMNDERYFRRASFDTIWPVKLDNGYWACQDCALEGTAYLSITISEFISKYDNHIWPDSLNECCIIEKKPFQEFYYRNDLDPREFFNGLGYHGLDTAKLNGLIREGKLEEHFKRKI